MTYNYHHNEKSSNHSVDYFSYMIMPEDQNKSAHTHHQANNEHYMNTFGKVKLYKYK